MRLRTQALVFGALLLASGLSASWLTDLWCSIVRHPVITGVLIVE